MFPTDIDLLGIQAEWSFDEAGRMRDRYGITIACTGEHQSFWIGADVPGTIAAELSSALAGATLAKDPAEPPPSLEPCRRILETSGRALQHKAGPSFVFADEARHGSDLRIERSDTANQPALRHVNPGNWHPVEWDELVDGRLGPWTMIIEDGRAVSICHTPHQVSARGAECGVWTDPAFRGRGYAAAVTAEWAAIMRSSGRYLFYSTDADNLSSQRVAARLQLRLIGWTWRLVLAPDREGDNLHPLCSLYPRR